MEVENWQENRTQTDNSVDDDSSGSEWTDDDLDSSRVVGWTIEEIAYLR